MRTETGTAVLAVAASSLVFGCKPASRPATVDAAQPPARASSPRGWRCVPGANACLDRAKLSPEFRCEGDRCLQAHPTMPDDGEWMCGETAGVTLCTGGEAAAGVAPAPLAAGWTCGARPSTRPAPAGDAGKDRVCIDASPDFPDGSPAGWRCYYDGAALPSRVCVRDPQAHSVGDPCDARHPCVEGAVCRAGNCALPRRVPSCWLDADCAAGVCRFGSCPRDPDDPDDPIMPIMAAEPPVPRAASATARGQARSAPRLDVGPAQAQVGFDAPFSITVKAEPGARPSRIAWKQVDGPTLPEINVSENGFRLDGRTVPWKTALATSEPRWGVVPISPRTRGEAVLEASWIDQAGRTMRQDVRVAAASLSRGLTTIPTDGRIYLGGEGWRLVRAAAGSHAAVEEQGGLASFTPDRSGVWRLRDGKGRTLDLIAGRYDDVPLDCARSGCHAEMLAGAAASPMTTVMARLLDGIPLSFAARAADYPGCALACHATGDLGIADGGFYDVARALNRGADEREPWSVMPRVLRRLGGAGCLSCHGPGAVPDPRASWTTLRSEVCAICHDAPPVYGHATAWRRSAKAHADRDPEAASNPPCTRCHTTWGFLLAEKSAAPKAARASNSAMAASRDHLKFMASLRPPKHAGAIGISCAACHDSHPTLGPSGKVPHALLRQVSHPRLLPPLPDGSASGICLPCHTPDPSRATVPSSSAAAIWLGRGGFDPSTGEALIGPAPLAGLEGGCVHCHKGEPSASRGANHSFVADRANCPDCPQDDPNRPDGVRQRARRLFVQARLQRIVGDVRPLHASRAVIRRNTPERRALWNLLLLLEDDAAEIHNPPYARALLESADSVLRSPRAKRKLE